MRLTTRKAKSLGIGVPSRVRPKATKPKADAMNKLERRYSEHLESLRLVGEIWRWDYEPIKLRLAGSTFYTPDFRVILADGTEEMHETKGGFIRDDAMVKIKVASELHPYCFVLVRFVSGRWTYDRFEGKQR